MATRKRAKLTAAEVLEDWDNLTDEDDWEGLGGIREPMTQGSDDEFSDLEENLEVEEECNEMEVTNAANSSSTKRDREVVYEPEHADDCDVSERDVNESEDTASEVVTDSLASPPLNPRDGTTWSSPGPPISVQPFTAHVGPTTTIPECPLDAFLLTFTPDLISLIVRESNKYAKEVMGQEKFATWEPISEDELRAYLGFSILMAISHVPALDDYWKKDPVLRYNPVAERIPRDRFRDITRYLHFADNSTLVPRGSPGHDRLGKVRPVLSRLGERFASLYDPSKHLSADEAMIKFQGRSFLKQYMPMKPVKRGIKVWVLADSTTGYFSRVEIYTGRQADRVETGLGSRVVKSLTADFHGKHHHVIFDNYFTSYNLLEDLLEVGVYGCGTARKDRRGFPTQLKNLKLKNR